MSKIFLNKYFILFLNICIFFALCVFWSLKLKYIYFNNDDILDLTNDFFYFTHGRFYCDLLSYFFVIYLPKLLNINAQDFSFFSQALNKSFFFVLLAYISSCSIWIVEKYKKYAPFLFFISFFYFISLIYETSFFNAFYTNQYFNSYLFPLIFLLLFCIKIFDFYVNDKNISKVELGILSCFVILLTMGNEQLLAFTVCFLSFLVIDYSHKKKVNYKYLFLLLISIITSIFVLTSNGFKGMYNCYVPALNLDFQFSSLFSYLKLFVKLVITDNWFMFLFLGVLFTILFLSRKENKSTNEKILKYVIFSALSFLVFYFLLYLCGKTNPYKMNDYWIFFPPFLFSFKVFLYTLSIMLFALCLNDKKILKLILCSIFLLYIAINIFRYCQNIGFGCLENKQTIYMTDKIAVFYLKQGKTAVVPVDDIHVIVPVVKWFFPEEITNNTYRGKVFYKDKCLPYFSYLNKVYNVDTTPGMMFLPTDEALDEFRKNGGILTDEELQELKFSRIEEQFVEKND